MKKLHEEKRDGRCFELAYRHILNTQEGTLIHAEVFSYTLGHTIEHALIETETGFIYEPVLDRYFEKDWLYRKYKVKELARYTVTEAAIMGLKTGNYGPWEETNSKEERR